MVEDFSIVVMLWDVSTPPSGASTQLLDSGAVDRELSSTIIENRDGFI
jgi:hypothetical protein